MRYSSFEYRQTKIGGVKRKHIPPARAGLNLDLPVHFQNPTRVTSRAINVVVWKRFPEYKNLLHLKTQRRKNENGVTEIFEVEASTTISDNWSSRSKGNEPFSSPTPISISVSSSSNFYFFRTENVPPLNNTIF